MQWASEAESIRGMVEGGRKCPKVAVLSAFPVYVLDYYGADALKEKLEK